MTDVTLMAAMQSWFVWFAQSVVFWTEMTGWRVVEGVAWRRMRRVGGSMVTVPPVTGRTFPRLCEPSGKYSAEVNKGNARTRRRILERTTRVDMVSKSKSSRVV